MSLLVLKNSVDSRWLIAGLAYGLLWLSDPLAIGMLPILLFSFWYFQRHFYVSQMLRRLALGAVPIIFAMLYYPIPFSQFPTWVSQSAFVNLVSANSSGGLSWTLSKSYSGQSFTVVFFLAGALAALFSSIGVLGRWIPLNQLLIVVLLTPYSFIASKIFFAAPAMQGIASSATGLVLRLIRWALFLLGVYEVYAVFS